MKFRIGRLGRKAAPRAGNTPGRPSPPRFPGATYRLQLGPGLAFVQAGEAAAYLEKLGVTDLYLAPVMRRGRGSTHGYDVVDHEAVDPGLGGEDAFARFADGVRAR